MVNKHIFDIDDKIKLEGILYSPNIKILNVKAVEITEIEQHIDYITGDEYTFEPPAYYNIVIKVSIGVSVRAVLLKANTTDIDQVINYIKEHKEIEEWVHYKKD